MKKEKERELSPAEQKRAEQFSLLCQQMEQSGYTRRDLTVGIVQSNIFGLLLMLPFAAASLFLFFMTCPSGALEVSMMDLLLWIVMILVLTVAHEGLHGLTWGICAKNHFRTVEFGFIVKYLTPYCTCAEPLTKGQYLLGGTMPTLVLGFGLSALSVCLGSMLMQMLAVVMLIAGGGDALIIVKLLRYQTVGKTVKFCDHPYACGVVAFEKAQ
ncbi:MAG: DUF3267 domain-containing protein [Clostridiales bacterium]|nr:DUF3267 domain-containing protein [Clostridiales bacterium]